MILENPDVTGLVVSPNLCPREKGPGEKVETRRGNGRDPNSKCGEKEDESPVSSILPVHFPQTKGNQEN